jgi:hypothetical protein
MSKKTKAFLFQFGSFAILFIIIRYLLAHYSALTGFWLPLTAAIVATLIAPQFQAIRTKDGEKLFMKWVFMKGTKEL